MTAVDYGPRRPAVPRYSVTRRQREALLWIARGRTAQQAGRRMGISLNTVNSLLAGLYRKLGASTGPHAVALAMARGLIAPADIEPPHARHSALQSPPGPRNPTGA
ncbi:response regulator transcription factor [Streptomyces sp. NRRL S-1868]|uniref:response regulator transcription factor n=1 Tax=Streptomyces sp. NRRL S-1868 TaxID=1463892 RepID=UPI00055FEF8B|nr:helix-turn-helix transcriptional regulator [Streptomyces sp. NRRL S-1868]